MDTPAQLMAEAENQLDHDRLVALINSLSDGFLATDEKGTIQLSNSVALGLLNTNSLTGKNLYQVLALVDQNGYAINIEGAITAADGNLASDEYSVKGVDGRLVKLHINIGPVKAGYGDKSQGGLVVTLRQIASASPDSPSINERPPTPVA